jgi:hypothetical protein
MINGKSEAYAAVLLGIFILGYYLYSGCFVLRGPFEKICEEPNALIAVLVVEAICGLIYGSYFYGKWKRERVKKED